MGDFGVTINGKHTTEFGMKMTSLYIPQPDVKTNIISLPCASGNIDLTEITGQINYEERTGIEFAFVLYDGNYSSWAEKVTELSMWLHGKKLKVIPDNDLGFYYMCRLNVDSKKSHRVSSSVVLTGTAEPFKYEQIASDEDWLWDPFNFETGIIRELMNLSITESENTVTIVGGGKAAVPEFIVMETVNLALVHNGKIYKMTIPGTYRFPAVKVAEQDVALNFIGTGKLSIRYRGAYL